MSLESTAADYVRQITTFDSDRRARAAFQRLVLQWAPPGGVLFDFGAGPGIDARYFAEHGFRVDTYDIKPSMRAFLTQYCRPFLESGQVTLDRREYREFLLGAVPPGTHRVDLIISDFAPLCLVANLNELFAKFHALTGPGGKLLASVLNPLFVGDMRFGWWWRNVPQLWREGYVSGPHGSVIRRRLAQFKSLSAPYFTLTRVYRGLPTSAGESPKGVDMSRSANLAWLHVAPSRFMFLLFERRT